MDPSRTQHRFRQQQTSASNFQIQSRDISDVGIEGFTLPTTILYTVLSAALLITSYVGYKRYVQKL